MNAGAAADLRTLIQQAVQLDGGRGGSLRHHELGPGIREKKEFFTDIWGRTALPRFGPALVRLREQFEDDVLDLPAQQAAEIRRKLLGSPALVTALPVSEELLLEDGVLSNGPLDAYRRIGIAAVFVPVGEMLVGGELTNSRVAGVGVYTALMRDTGVSVEDAWFSASWADTTTSLVTGLSDLMGVHTREPGADAPRVTVVTTGALAYDDAFADRIQLLTNIIGLRSSILRLQSGKYTSVRAAVIGRVARYLVFVGESGIGDIGDAFMHAIEGNRVLAVTDRSAEAALYALQERLSRIAGYGPGLIKLAEPIEQDTLPTMPIDSPDECYHYSGRVYVHDRSTRRWWTRDDANHAKVRFKSYRRTNNVLEWQQDHEAGGEPYTRKHKGDEGREVPLSGGHSCQNVKSHLYA